MPLVIENPTTEKRIHAFATSRGRTPDEAILTAIEAAEEALPKAGAVAPRQSFDQMLQSLAEIMGSIEPGVVLDDSRESYHVDDQGRLPRMNGYGDTELGIVVKSPGEVALGGEDTPEALAARAREGEAN
jgi:hypothetical protein